MKPFPFYQQLDRMDCGPTCLRMIARHYGKHWSLQDLRDRSGINREGVSLLGISEAAEKIGFRTLGVKIAFAQLTSDVPLPCIVHWQQEHFVVVYKISRRRFRKEVTVHVADPAKGLLTYSREEFCAGWTVGGGEGLALALEPTAAFLAQDTATPTPAGWGRVWPHVLRYRSLLVQLLLGLLVGSVLQLIFPFLPQAVVDVGVNTRNLSFVYLLLAAQLMLFAGRTAVEFIRSWILLHMGARLNLSLLSDFLSKLMQLPLSFFDTKLYGDLVQRVHDHERIIKFAGYPFEEYGAVEGRITTITQLAGDDSTFSAKVHLPAGFTTSYGKRVYYRVGMQANAEIITEDTSLLERLVYLHRKAKPSL